jgi:cullin 1
MIEVGRNIISQAE